MSTAYRIPLTLNQHETLMDMVRTAIADYEDDARDGIAYLEDEPLRWPGEYPHEEEREMAVTFRDWLILFYHIFKEDWQGQWGFYTTKGKWGGSALNSGRWAGDGS